MKSFGIDIFIVLIMTQFLLIKMGPKYEWLNHDICAISFSNLDIEISRLVWKFHFARLRRHLHSCCGFSLPSFWCFLHLLGYCYCICLSHVVRKRKTRGVIPSLGKYHQVNHSTIPSVSFTGPSHIVTSSI